MTPLKKYIGNGFDVKIFCIKEVDESVHIEMPDGKHVVAEKKDRLFVTTITTKSDGIFILHFADKATSCMEAILKFVMRFELEKYFYPALPIQIADEVTKELLKSGKITEKPSRRTRIDKDTNN